MRKLSNEVEDKLRATLTGEEVERTFNGIGVDVNYRRLKPAGSFEPL